MIARITGVLETVEKDRALVALPVGLVYEVLVPAFTAARLGGSIGQSVTLHTLEFHESQNQGATVLPRLAGFLTVDDRAFYELFVTCKGIGHKRALRAMAMSSAQIAGAIADRDLATLQSLPEVGKRTAETIAVTLKGKVDRFLGGAAQGAGASTGDAASAPVASTGGGVAREALEVLLQLGENRTDAVAWIDRVLSDDSPPRDAQAVVRAVYRLKSG